MSQGINRRQSGRTSGGGRAGQFLSAIDAVSKAVSHTNEAARRARQDGEAHQHHSGLPHVFLTTTPDDDNSILVQLYANSVIDDDAPVNGLTDEELRQRAKLRTELRIKHPGICAFFYELMLDIILEEVIGWDLENVVPKPDGGLLGIPEAFTASTEEQGRTTLHTHWQVWIRGFQERRNKLCSTNSRERHAAEKDISPIC